MQTLQVAPEILARIKKLAAMADRGTEHEAALAAAKMQELLTEYNLTRMEVESTGEEKKGQDAKRERFEEFRTAMYKYQRELMETVAGNNFCLHIIRSRGRLKSHVLIGRTENVQASIVMYDYLMEAMHRNCTYSKSAEKVLWLTGCAEMICKRLREKRTGQEEKEVSGGTPGLVRLADLYGSEEDLNEDFLHKQDPGTTARKRREREAREAERQRREEELEKKAEELVASGTDSWDARYIVRGMKPESRPSRVERGSYRRSSGGGGRVPWARWAREEARANSPAYKAGRECGSKMGIGGSLGSGKAIQSA